MFFLFFERTLACSLIISAISIQAIKHYLVGVSTDLIPYLDFLLLKTCYSEIFIMS